MEELRHESIRPYHPGMGPHWELETWDTLETDHYGKSVLGYRLTEVEGDKRTIIFEGEDFACSPRVAIDSDECLASIMGFLTLRVGDTDSEYFDEYTKAQRDFRDCYAEEVACEVSCMWGDEW